MVNQSNLEIKKLLTQLSIRLPWAVSKNVLNKIGLHTSNGWEGAIKKQDIYESSEAAKMKCINKLRKLYLEHTLVGEKLVYMFSLKGISTETANKFHEKIIKNYKKIDIKESIFKTSYPYSVTDENSLVDAEKLGVVLTGVDHIQDKLYFHFSSVISYKEKIEISTDTFNDKDKKKLNIYDEIFGILAKRKQSHDVVVYDIAKKNIEVRIDAPLGINFDFLSVQTNNVYIAFNLLSEKFFGYAPLGDHSLNFFSSINKIYRNDNDGIVHELGFVAIDNNSSSNNQGKLVKGKNRDLRRDKFHVGGSSAVNEITPYKIGVSWIGDSYDGAPDLTLPGNMRMLLKNPNVPMAVIRNCLSVKDYDFVVARLLHYATSATP